MFFLGWTATYTYHVMKLLHVYSYICVVSSRVCIDAYTHTYNYFSAFLCLLCKKGISIMIIRLSFRDDKQVDWMVQSPELIFFQDVLDAIYQVRHAIIAD